MKTKKKINKQLSLEEILNEAIAEKYSQFLTEETKKEESKDKKEEKTSDKKDTKEKTDEDKEGKKALEDAGIKNDDMEAAAKEAGLDEKKKGWFIRSMSFLGKMLNSAADSQIASNLDDFTLGNFREIVCDIYKKKLSKMSEDELAKEQETLHKFPGFEKAAKNADLSSRKDDNENTEIDESSATCNCLFWSKDPKENLLKQLSDLTVEIQKEADKLAKSKEKLKQEVKSKNIKGVEDGDIDAFGPMIKKMIDDGKSADEISNEVSKMKTGVKESFNRKIRKFTKQKLLTEGKCFITEKQKNIFLMEALIESDQYIDSLTYFLITEGFFDGIKKFGKATKEYAAKKIKSGAELAKAAWSKVPDSFKQKIKDLSEKALGALKDGALGPILSIAGIGLMVITGSWGIALILATMTLIAKHGKYLKASFDKHWEAFKNSKGVIAQMDFNIKDNPDLKYSMRFYIIDQTWRVLNLRNQSKTPSLDFAKAIIKSNLGQKYTKALNDKWDPVFNKEKGGKVDFKQLLSQSKDLKLDDKQLQMLDDFKKSYDKTIAAINKPQIDTRSISTKDAIKNVKK